jgi:hypothetical protein
MRKRASDNPTVLFVTYTMANPDAVGVFFRAVRLSLELTRRGWQCVICNRGPIPQDPKTELARKTCHLMSFDAESEEHEFPHAVRLFREIAPDIVVFGEYPIPSMELLFRAARVLAGPPLLLLEQFYCPECISSRYGVDAYLLYGVRSPWPEQPEQGKGYQIVPPFIEEVTPIDRLPAVLRTASAPMIAVLGFDAIVLRGGIALIAALQVPVFAITISHSPAAADQMMQEAGIPAERRMALALQEDPDLFGLIAASRVTILANGFMQIVEALALGCPAVCIQRGLGMDGWALDQRLRPFISFEEPPEVCLERVRSWIECSPFSDGLRDALQAERHGLTRCANAIEEGFRRPRLYSKMQRWADRMALPFRTGHLL